MRSQSSRMSDKNSCISTHKVAVIALISGRMANEVYCGEGNQGKFCLQNWNLFVSSRPCPVGCLFQVDSKWMNSFTFMITYAWVYKHC